MNINNRVSGEEASSVSPIRILLADDHSVLRQGLALILNTQTDMTVVGEASNGEEAIALYRRYQPDVALIDLKMPDVDGIQVIARIRAESPRARLIILTTYDRSADIARALQAGARAYLVKDTSAQELLACIRQVHRGHKHIPPKIGAKLAETLVEPELSPREIEVLQLLAAGRTNQEIATALFISESTVKFHIAHIFSKLNVTDRIQATLVALQRGLADLS